jgi:TonB family protein
MATHMIWFTLIRVIGWTLVHFLWQGTLLGLVYFSVRSILPRGTARYRFGMGILFALAACPLVTMWQLLDTVSLTPAAGQAPAMSLVVGEPVAGGAGHAVSGFDVLLPWLVLAWSIGVLLHSVRACMQWRALKMLVREAEQLPQWQQRIADMAGRFALHRRITVLGSRIISSPVLIGWIRPVILLPMAVVCGFPASQVELILAHELAHLRRWDPLANLFQVVLETVHFYHPVVRWISRDVNNEREICCDRLALALGGGSRREFVAVLAELGDLRMRQKSLVLAANGGVLLDRVQLMVLPQQQVGRLRKGGYTVALVLCAAMAMLTVRLQWIQAQMNDGMNVAIRQLHELVMPAALPLMSPPSTWQVPNLLQIPSGAIRLVEAKVTADAPGAMAFARPVDLGRPAAVSLVNLRSDAFDVLAMRPMEAIADPAVTVVTPTPVRVRQPVYPRRALSDGIEGRVVVEFALGRDGGVRDLRLVSSVPVGVFDQAALDAMRSWKYAVPAGVASTRYRQILSFTLKSASAGRQDGQAAATENIQAKSVCQIPTGTHICRWPDNETTPDKVAPGAVSR